MKGIPLNEQPPKLARIDEPQPTWGSPAVDTCKEVHFFPSFGVIAVLTASVGKNVLNGEI